MQFKFTDYNRSEKIIKSSYQREWSEVEKTILNLPLHLKPSDQDGIIGNPIFDPVGTNKFLKDSLTKKGWTSKFAIPGDFKFLGTGIDFVKPGIILEVQFSNYPFLLNNTVRSELFIKSKMGILERKAALIILITKCHMFPASNSTLYYEQAVRQLNELFKYKVLTVPLRLIGLKERTGNKVKGAWTHRGERYSRTGIAKGCYFRIISSKLGRCRISKLH